MNNPDQTPQPTENSVRPMTIMGAEQYARKLWEATQAELAEEEPHVAPPGSEAVEDEVSQVKSFVEAWITANDTVSQSTEVALISKHAHGLVTVYVVEVYRRFLCGKCDELHSDSKGLIVVKDGNGTMTTSKPECILDRTDELEEKQEDQSSFAIRIDLGGIVEQMVDAKAKQKMAEQDQDGEDDPLPPAATSEDEGDEVLLAQLKEIRNVPLTPEESASISQIWERAAERIEAEQQNEDTAQLPKIDMDQLHMVEGDEEDHTPVPSWAVLELAKMDRDLQRRDGRFGWFWRAWFWLWRR